MAYQLITILTLSFVACSTPLEKKSRITKNAEVVWKDEVDSSRFKIDKGVLRKETEKLYVSYAAISCPCAQWFETKFAGDTTIEIDYFYLEPSDSKIIDADTLFNGLDFPVRVSVWGKFYERKGYPKNYFPTKGNPKPARVFRYHKIKIIQIGDSSMAKGGL